MLTLPPGLKYHCSQCMRVVPTDAPEVPARLADCAAVVRAGHGWFNPKETRAAQYVMAAATWVLIHDAAVKAGHGRACEFSRRLHGDRKALYAGSEARKGLTPEDVAAEAAHRRDGWLHA